nr:LamG-like jellyroll fold domain-containing protein [Paenibacillus aceris]
MLIGTLSNTAVNAESDVINASPLMASIKFDNNLEDDANQGHSLIAHGNYSYVDGVLPGTKALHVESGNGNYVSTTQSLNVGNDSFTTSFWYKGDTKDNQVILSNKDFSKSSNAGWAIYTSNNSVNMNLGFPTTSVKFGRDTFNASAWRYVTFVVDRDKMLGSLYIDGYEMAETSLGVGTLDTSNPLNIGSDGVGGNGGNSFDIADLKVWRGALSSDAVQASYNGYGLNKVDMKALNDTISEANTIVAGGLGSGFSQTDFDYLKKVLNTASGVATTQKVKLYTQETINYYERELNNAIFIYQKSNKTLTPADLNIADSSDPEISSNPATIARVEADYRKALKVFPQADVLVQPGDITGGNNANEYVWMGELTKVYNKLKAEGLFNTTKLYIVKGNHDMNGTENLIPVGTAGAWNDSTNSYDNDFYNSAYRVKIKGYNLIGFDANINSSSTVGKAKDYLNQIKSEADYDPTKPIFAMSHYPISGTVWGSAWSSGASNNFGKFIADNNFSQVFYMSGHTQYDPTDERSLYQGTASFLDSGGSNYSSYQDDGPFGGYIEGSYGSYHTTPRISNFIEVYGTKLILKQYNLATDEFVSIPRVVNVGEGKDAFTYSKSDTRDLIAPQLDEGSIKVDYLDFINNEVGFTLKQATDNVRNLEYNIQLINKLTGKVDKSFNSLSYPMDKPYDVYRQYKFTGLSPATPYIIRVFADDSMYNRSSQDIEIMAHDVNLNSITVPSDVTDVAFGAAKTANGLGLPKTVSLVTDAFRVDANVTWNVDASNYDPNVKTPQTFKVNGTVTLPTIVANPNDVPLTISIRVTVNKFSVPTANATATASSNFNNNYTPNKVIDGIKGGQPGVGEWASNGEQNPWIQVNWPTNQTINKITFYDRANSSDWAQGGTLTFSDGSTLTVSGIPNDGSGYSVYFPARKVTWVKFQISGNSGGNNGLSEMEFSWIVPDGVPLKLMSITAPAAITGVNNGTAKTADALGLPKTVSMVTDAYSVDGNVTWNVDASSYDPTVKTAQTFTVNGTVALPTGVENSNNVSLTTSINVTVKEAVSASDHITLDKSQYIQGEAITLSYNGAALNGKDWVGIYRTGAVPPGAGVSLIWSYLKSGSGKVSLNNGLAPGTYDALFLLNDGYTIVDRKTFQVVQRVTLKSITAPTAIQGLANGTAKTEAALGLPSTVELVTDAGSKNANVTWNVGASSYDPAQKTAQTFTVNGTVILPADVVNPNNVALTTSISVTVLPAPATAQSTLTGLQQVAPGQTFNVMMGLSNVTQSVYQQVYGQDLTLHYDPVSLQFNSVKSLKEGFQVIDQNETVPGQVRIVAASVGSNVYAQGDMLSFQFTAKSVAQATIMTSISIDNVVIANGQGNELQVGGASHEIQISTPVDKSLLTALIANAQAKYNAAEEGNGNGLYAIGAKAQLQSAIGAASAIANNPNATQQQVDSAKSALEAAVQVFETKRINADINGGGVSIGDLAIVAAAYGKQQGQPGWNVLADVNKDGKVGLEDLAIVALAMLK